MRVKTYSIVLITVSCITAILLNCDNSKDRSKQAMLLGLSLISSGGGSSSGSSSSSGGGGVTDAVADHRFAKESVLRSIPQTAIDTAKNNLKIYYFHTSHGSRVISGMTGLMNYKSDDNTKFAFTTGGTAQGGKLWFQEDGYDLSAQESDWDTRLRAHLNAHPEINVAMGSWCDPAGHDHQSYINRMEQLIAEYPAVTFVFMTGHPNGDGESPSSTGAYHCHDLVSKHCRNRGRFCIDYWDIETHGVDDTYYAGANDNGVAGAVSFYDNWIASHAPGTDYFAVDDCAHATQPVTCNRIAYASWWIWARIAGWNGQ